MTKKEILEGDKLIADFMGVSPESTTKCGRDFYDGYKLFKAGLPFNYGAQGNGTDTLPFSTSWDWLMVVVEKINNMTDKFGNNYNFQIGNGYVWVDPYIGDRIYFSGNETNHREEPMIMKAYRGVVAFIKWYKIVQNNLFKN